jgi:hypothetical protein
MKRLALIPLILILIIALVLSACSGSAPTAAMATETPQPVITEIAQATATYTPEPTATVAATATEFVDPNIPAGYTKDASGNYTKNENGFTYTWDKERNEGSRTLLNAFAWDVDPKREADGQRDSMKIVLTIGEGIVNEEALTLTHKENMDPDNTRNWTFFFENTLLDGMSRQGQFANQTGFSYQKWYSPEGYIIPYETKEGKKTLRLGVESVMRVDVRSDFKALEAGMDTNGFSKVKSLGLGPIKYYMVKISSDDKGNMIVEMAPSETDALKWTDGEIHEMLFSGLGWVLERQPDALEPSWSTFTSILAGNLNKYKFVDITRTK